MGGFFMNKQSLFFFSGVFLVILSFIVISYTPLNGTVWEIVIIVFSLIICLFLLYNLKDKKNSK